MADKLTKSDVLKECQRLAALCGPLYNNATFSLLLVDAVAAQWNGTALTLDIFRMQCAIEHHSLEQHRWWKDMVDGAWFMAMSTKNRLY